MSVQTQVNRLRANVENSFVAVAAKGGAVPESQNSDNLPDAIMGIPAGSGSDYKLSITFEPVFLGRPYTVTGPNNETYSGTVPESLVEVVDVNSGGAEYVVTSTDASGKQYSTTILTGSTPGAYGGTLRVVHIYGATWDGTSTTKWTRTDGSALFTDPVPYVAGASNYGSPFDDIMPWAGMTTEERTGGTMVKIPKFWYQLYQNTEGTPSSGMTIRIASEPVEGFLVSPAHMDRGDGKGERDVVYVGRYHCASDYKSKTGQSPKVNITRSAARSGIHALGSNIWQMDFATRFTIWLLYLVEFADWNSQACIGHGCGNGSSTENMGYTDSMPYHTGTTKSNRDTYGIGTQYRYIEGLWDNVTDCIDGCYTSDAGLNIILDPSSYSDSSGGVSIGTPSNGYPYSFTVSNKAGFTMFYPEKSYPYVSSGSVTAVSCDYWISNFRPIIFGGGSYDQQHGKLGLFCINSQTPASFAAGNLGTRSMDLPN